MAKEMHSLMAEAVPEDLKDLALLEEQPKFSLLLDMSRQLRLRDASLRLFSSASKSEEPGLKDEVRKHAKIALGRLREAVKKGDLGQDVQAMADACHGAWVLASALSGSTSGNSLLADLQFTPAAEVGRRPVDETAFLLSTLCLEGPVALRPALLPCVGLLVQGRGHLLSLHPSLLESLRAALSSRSRAPRARAVETVVGILTGSPGEHGSGAVTRQLACLQSELLSFLAAEVPPSVTTAALTSLEALTDAAVVVPTTALPLVLAECLAGNPCNTIAAQGLLLRLATTVSHSLPECLSLGVRRAAETLTKRGVGPGELLVPLLYSAEPIILCCAQLSKEMRYSCTSRLLADVASLRGSAEEDASHCSFPLLGALLFRLIMDFAPDYASIVHGISESSRELIRQDACSVEPPIGTCVAALVLSAVSRSSLHDVAAPNSFLVLTRHVTRLAEHLEDLDFDEPVEPEHLRTMMATCMQQLVHLGKATVPENKETNAAASDSVAPLMSTLPIQSISCLGVESKRELPSAQLPAAASADTADSSVLAAYDAAYDAPWYTAYDASCDKWRCTLCAGAGGRNPYAKGISIPVSLVAMRMRIHARSAIHKQADERKQKERSKEEGNQTASQKELAAHECEKDGCSKRSLSRKLEAGTMKSHTLAAATDDTRAAKRRRFCGKPLSHDLRICRPAAANSAALVDPSIVRSSKGESAARKNEPWQRLQDLCGQPLKKRSALGGA